MPGVPDVIERAAETIAQRGLACAHEPVVLMVSGGSDSTALAYIACELREREILGPIGIMHLNHCLRGEASDGDAEFVASLAGELGVPLFSYRQDIAALVRESGQNMEALARRERYAAANDALEKLCRMAGEPSSSGRIFTAHTQNDRVENFYMRSIVGTGPGGFRSMLYRNGALSRPLLDANRDQLRDFLRRRALDASADAEVPIVRDAAGSLWREDATNAHTDQFRAYVRHNIVPAALARNPKLFDTLCRSMNLIADEDDMLDAQARSIVADQVTWLAQDAGRSCEGGVEGRMPSSPGARCAPGDGEGFSSCLGADCSQGCLVKPGFVRQAVPLQRRAMVMVLQSILGFDARVETRSVEAALAAFGPEGPKSGYTNNIQGDLALSSNKRGLRIEPMAAYRARRKKGK